MVVVTVQPDGVTVDLREGETLLAGLQRLGYLYRWGCRRGGCGVCKVDVVAGAVGYSGVISDTVLSLEEREGGTALSCQAVPEGELTVALRNDRLTAAAPWLLEQARSITTQRSDIRQGEKTK